MSRVVLIQVTDTSKTRATNVTTMATARRMSIPRGRQPRRLPVMSAIIQFREGAPSPPAPTLQGPCHAHLSGGGALGDGLRAPLGPDDPAVKGQPAVEQEPEEQPRP